VREQEEPMATPTTPIRDGPARELPTARPPTSPPAGLRRLLVVARTVANLALVLVLVSTLLVAYGLADNRWYRILSVHGNSMAPTLWAGDAIVITRPPERIEPGMVLTFQVDGQVVTHRVVDIADDGGLVVRGDANETIDDWGDNELRVVGIHRLRIPKLGALLDRGGDQLGAAPPTAAWLSSLETTGNSTVHAEVWGAATGEP
jgi:signal peptidase I